MFRALLLFSATAIAQPVPGRYIVELSGEPAVTVRTSERQSRRAAIQTEQRAAARAVTLRGGRVLTTMDTTLNALVVLIPDSRAAELRNIPGVTRITQDRMYWAKLDRVLTLSNVPQAWEKLGGVSKAGLGVGVAILDSGIDTGHPGFKDDSLIELPGYPRASGAGSEKLVTRKVIVVRSYEDLAKDEGYGTDAADNNGHGTNAACASACIVHETNIGVIAGAAPKAYLGAYKVCGDNGSCADSLTLKGIDDAVKDGFDVLNLSLGSDIAGDPANDAQVRALNLAADAGHIVVVAAGNAGPDENTINSPGTAEKVITVGSSSSDRSLESGKPEPIDPARLSGFSSRGPNPGNALKPDMTAVGDNFFTATTRRKDPEKFYTLTQGTSFATPTVAGAAATLKAARPGLTSATYRSLLINSSSDIKQAPIRHQGAGRLDLSAALDAPIAFAPTSVKFGTGGAAATFSREITVSNLLKEPVTVDLSIRGYEGKTSPTLDGPAKLELPAEGSAKVTLKFSGEGLAGEYQGYLVAKNSKNGLESRVPYWYGARSSVAKAITLLEFQSEGEEGETMTFGCRVVDASGIEIVDAQLTVTSMSGGKVVGVEAQTDKPGVFLVELTPAKGDNVFQFSAGGITRTVEITGN
ncbi:MAG: hypothetical protein FJW32_05670 [Acidobacteria bacterium]|nr:hypothetical protein [Acidobacteriota bacterium]